MTPQAAQPMAQPPTTADAPHAPPAIHLEALTHRYGPVTRWHTPRPALDQVSLDIEQGESVAILGPNGGGKTTLIRILATLLTPSDKPGALTVLGKDALTQPRAIRQQMGMVFQSPSLDDQLTARENLRHHGHLYGLRGQALHEQIHHWLQRFELSERADERVQRFSGGMRRRVELAKALLHQPKLLLMDEPATGLDPAARRELWRHLEQLRAEQGVTLMLTTHLIEEAERCQRVAIVNQGRLVAMDRPAALKAEVGGEVLTIEPVPGPDNSAQTLAALVDERFGPFDPTGRPKAVNGTVRFEMPGATEWVADLTYELPERIQRITVGQPTLEDVFIHHTGASFQRD
jgi:ABC-2 type transport system ATP-binding protein